MANDFFIKIDGIDGESVDKSHGNWIECTYFQHGSAQPIVAGRSTDVSGRGHFIPFTFSHLIDKATPKIQQFCMSGQKIAKVQFQVCRAVAGAQVPVYEITLENVKISSARVGNIEIDDEGTLGDDTSGVPTETVNLIAAKMTWKYTAIKEDNTKDGAVEANFNQVENS